MADDRIELFVGDITSLDVDAIVNAANDRLAPGGGVCGAIHRAAGPRLAEACAALGGSPTGEARITPGFDLKARHVIHAVGPVWHGGNRGEPEQLASAYRSVLGLCVEHELDSIAFPAISAGIYGYPLDQATDLAVGTVRDWLAGHERPRRVIFCAFGPEVEQAYRVALAQ